MIFIEEDKTMLEEMDTIESAAAYYIEQKRQYTQAKLLFRAFASQFQTIPNDSNFRSLNSVMLSLVAYRGELTESYEDLSAAWEKQYCSRDGLAKYIKSISKEQTK